MIMLKFRASAPCMGAYAASKFAMEAVTDSLRQELRPWNVSVSAIEPGFIRTPLVTNSFAAFEKNWDELGENVMYPWLRSCTVVIQPFSNQIAGQRYIQRLL